MEDISKSFRTKLGLIYKAVSSLRKKIVQSVFPMKSKTVWTIQRTSIKIFWAKLEQKYIAVILLRKKNRAMFSSHQVKLFGDYQPNFRAKREQKNEFMFFPRKKIHHSLLLIRSKTVCKKSTIFFRALFKLIL